jgi:hypothetical protein
MKGICDGKRYDTDRAEELACASFAAKDDPAHWEECLFRTERGAFFLAATGGPESKYGVPVDMQRFGPGERIVPLEPDKALRWAEQNAPMDVIERAFASIIQDA